MATRARDLVLGPVGGASLLWLLAVAEIALGAYPVRIAAIATAAIAPLALRRPGPPPRMAALARASKTTFKRAALRAANAVMPGE